MSPAKTRRGAASRRIELQEAIEFIWLEADLLDSQDYDPWLALWTATGHYVIPIERAGDDHAAYVDLGAEDHSSATSFLGVYPASSSRAAMM